MKRLFVIPLLLLAVACAKGTANYSPVPFSFKTAAPTRINAAEVRLIPTYQAPMAAPNVEHLFPTPPAKAAEQWVRDRLVAVGSQGVMEISIEDASVKEVKLPKKTGVEGWFTDDQDARYDAKLTVSMRLYEGSSGLSVASADVSVTRSRTINEKASVADRERLFDLIIQEMMAQFENQANAQLSQYFASYIVR